MATLPKLRMAKKQLGLDVDNRHLLELSRNPSTVTERDIVKVLREAGLERSAEDVANLYQILNFANSLGDEDQDGDNEPAIRVIESKADLKAAIADISAASPSAQLSNDEAKPANSEPEVAAPDDSSAVVAAPDKQIPEAPSVELELDSADYQEVDLFGDGGAVQTLLIEKTGTGQTAVTWKVPARDNRVFVLAASEVEFPRVIRDGQATWTTKKSSLVISGAFRYFTLFAFEAAGSKGAQIAQGRVLGEVLDVEFEAYEDQVRLRWQANDSQARVCVYRSKPDAALPTNPPASMRLNVADGADSFIDTDVRPGQEFEYKVFLEWEGPDGRVIPTEGKKVTVSVAGQIADVQGFKVTRLDEKAPYVDIEYDEPPLGAVKVFQVKGQPDAELLRASQGNQEFDASRLADADIAAWLGTEIIDQAKVDAGRVRIAKVPMLAGDRDSRTYIAVGVLGKKARICKFEVIQQVGEISSVDLRDYFDYQLLRVGRPEGAQALQIWLRSPASDVDAAIEALPAIPDRTVQIDEEYRRFGGIVFANNVPGYPSLTTLPHEPLSIYVRGVSMFDGNPHTGPVRHVKYLGRVSVAYRRGGSAPSAQPVKSKGFSLFKREEGAAITVGKQNLQLQMQFPDKLTGTPIDLNHLAAQAYPLDGATPGLIKKPTIRVIPGNLRNWESVAISAGDGQAPQPVMLEPDYQFRISSAASEVDEIPVFTVDDRVSSLKYPQLAQSAVNKELSVVLVGAKQSGKTTYVQSLLNYFDQQFSQLLGARLLPLVDSDEIAISRLESMKRFVKTGRLPDATRSARQFLSADATAPQDPADPTKSLNFKFFNGGNVPLSAIRMIDVAGEDMDALETMKYYEQALLKADLVVFLMDPLQLPAVRTALAGSPLPPAGTDPFLVMQNLVTILTASGAARNPNQKIAVTLSKYDAFQGMSSRRGSPIEGTIQKGMQITRDPNSNSGQLYSDIDGHLVESEILAILNRLNIAPFESLVRNAFAPGTARYFVVSSLGHATHAEELDSAGITSFRVSDPIRWALHREIYGS